MIKASKVKGWEVNKHKNLIQSVESKDDSWPKEDSTAQKCLGISQTPHESRAAVIPRDRNVHKAC